MRYLAIVLVIFLALLQYKLWFGAGGVTDAMHTKKLLKKQQLLNKNYAERDKVLLSEVQALRKRSGAVKQEAREELGMIKKGEVFYRVVPLSSDLKK
ncbi:MAG: septum formation initiator family protein [Gammaproteobacteria bacterium]|nr:septum formation initiator family protein [Gammaproteobacteria bacterium]